MACENEQAEVDGLTAMIADLQETLGNSPPGTKPGILKQIDKANVQLEKAQQRLAICVGGTQLGSTMMAKVTLVTSNSQAAGPFTVDGIELGFVFQGPNLVIARLTSFPAIVPPPFNTPVGTNTTTITRIGAGNESFDRASGELILTTRLRFDHSLFLAGDSEVDLVFTTEPVSSPAGLFQDLGSRVTKFGGVRLAAAGTFEGGFLGGADCLVTVEGVLAPSPRD